MTHFTGIDIIEIARIEQAVDRWGERFLKRVYSDEEIRFYARKTHSLAARFAAKESIMKLLDRGNTSIGWREIEVLSEPGGRPLVNLYGKARDEANRLGITGIAISLSHSKEYAIASVISENRQT